MDLFSDFYVGKYLRSSSIEIFCCHTIKINIQRNRTDQHRKSSIQIIKRIENIQTIEIFETFNQQFIR